MIPFPALLALQIAVWSMWIEAFGGDPAEVLRAAADVLDQNPN
jgi:hypothetical protein